MNTVQLCVHLLLHLTMAITEDRLVLITPITTTAGSGKNAIFATGTSFLIKKPCQPASYGEGWMGGGRGDVHAVRPWSTFLKTCEGTAVPY